MHFGMQSENLEMHDDNQSLGTAQPDTFRVCMIMIQIFISYSFSYTRILAKS